MVVDIISKLQAELHEEMQSERQVLYILVQTRKLIECDRRADDLEKLRLHCDWTVHPRLNLKKAKKLVAKMNSWYTTVRQPNTFADFRELGQHLNLTIFRSEFLEFLNRYKIEGPKCDANWWFAFLYNYCRIIQDCPLETNAEPGFYFDRIALIDPSLDINPGALSMQWDLSLNGQGICSWQAHVTRDNLA